MFTVAPHFTYPFLFFTCYRNCEGDIFTRLICVLSVRQIGHIVMACVKSVSFALQSVFRHYVILHSK